MATKKNEKREHESMRCVSCGKDKRVDKNFYVSNSKTYPNGRYPVCRLCLKKDLDTNNIEQVQDTLLEMNKPFIYTLWNSTCDEAKSTGKDLFGLYMKNVSLNFRGYTWKDSEFNKSHMEDNVDNKDIRIDEQEEKQIVSNDKLVNEETSEGEDKNREDVLRMLGYDPFENEPKSDKRHLYNKLVDFLDESTLEDSFKLPAVIVIVKTFNQLDKIDIAISKLVNNINTSNAGGLKSLITSKKDMLKAVLDLAKENGISVNSNHEKGKGAGTLSGIIKQLQEKNFDEAEVNLFDIETSLGIRQVADLSNESIVKQLQLDENDYQGMLLEQREIIEELTNKVSKLEEENRRYKKELLKNKDGGSYE